MLVAYKISFESMWSTEFRVEGLKNWVMNTVRGIYDENVIDEQEVRFIIIAMKEPPWTSSRTPRSGC